MAKKQQKEKEDSLLDYQWDSENDFFGVPNTAVEEKPVVDEVKGDEEEEEVIEEEKSKKPKKKEEEVKEEESDEEAEEEPEFFNEDDDKKDKGGKEEDDEDEDEPEVIGFDTVIKEGLFKNIELSDEERENLTVEQIEELYQKDKDNYVDEILNGMKEDAGDSGVAFIKHVSSGGDPKEFFRLYREESDAPDLNIDDEKNHDSIIKYYLKNHTKYSEEDISDHLEWLEENGKKKKYAEKYSAAIEEDFTTRKEQLAKAQEEKNKVQEKRKKEAAKELREKLETEKIGSYNITKDDKSKLLSDITKATVKIGDNKYITPLQAKIGEAFNDPEKLILLAKVVMSDFDTSDIETQAATQVAKRVKNKIVTSGKVKPSSKPKERKRRLTDFFD